MRAVFIERGRVKAVDRQLGGIELGGEVDREHDLRELAAAIGIAGVVAAFEHHVREVDRRFAERRHVDDARRRSLEQR